MRFTFLIIKDYRQYHSLSSGPIGLAYLAAAARAAFPDIEFTIEVDPDRVMASRPDIVGVSAFTETYSQSIEAARRIRRTLGVPVWLGGPHINALPMTLAEPFDLGVVGEGEETFVDLLRLFRAGHMSPRDLQAIPGLVYWEEGERKLTPPRAINQHLDTIPAPDRSVMKTYWPPAGRVIDWPQPIYTSRGCPFKCVFCIYSMESQKVRYHSVERVILELEDILRRFPDQDKVTIHDDLFTLSKKRLRELVEAIRSAGIHKRLSFISMAKASVFDREMAILLREMNTAVVTFGFESGVQRQLEYLKGERCKVEENVRAIELCARHGIRVGGYFIIGTPHETYPELQQAYWFIRNHYPPMSMAGIFRLTPFPGTRFWQESVTRGLVSDAMDDWRPFNYADYEKRDYLFVNENYSLADFKAAYAHFCRLMERNSIGPTLEEHEKILVRQQETIYQSLARELPQGLSILEISGSLKLSLQDTLEENAVSASVTRLLPWEFAEFSPTGGFDLIICHFALEQMASPAAGLVARLAAWLNPGGQILFQLYNPRHISILTRLLTGQWDSLLWGFRPFDFLQFLTVEQLGRLLHAHRLPIQACTPFQHTPLSPQQRQVLEMLRPAVPGQALDTCADFAYTVLTGPKEERKDDHEHLKTAVQSGAG